MFSSNKGMENLGKRSEPASSLLSRYPNKPHDFLRGYPPDMYKRRCDALILRNIRTGGKCASETKICFWPCGVDLNLQVWHQNLYGFTRVVVHGVDSLCAVARTEDVDRVICQGKDAYPFMSLLLKNALIYEAEDLALPHGEEGKLTCQSFGKPFVAVSLAPGTNNGHEASWDEYDVRGAIGFLKEEIKCGTTFTFDESVKAAVCTLEYLFGKRFKANEIKVFYVENHSGRVVGAKASSEVANEFPARAERSIEDHLSVIKYLQCSGGSSCIVSS